MNLVMLNLVLASWWQLHKQVVMIINHFLVLEALLMELEVGQDITRLALILMEPQVQGNSLGAYQLKIPVKTFP